MSSGTKELPRPRSAAGEVTTVQESFPGLRRTGAGRNKPKKEEGVCSGRRREDNVIGDPGAASAEERCRGSHQVNVILWSRYLPSVSTGGLGAEEVHAVDPPLYLKRGWKPNNVPLSTRTKPSVMTTLLKRWTLITVLVNLGSLGKCQQWGSLCLQQHIPPQQQHLSQPPPSNWCT
ncbi:uncharacterized protein LOC144785576 [Lissotriton helveticus]